MTEKRARALHRAMWRWLAKHWNKTKWAWPGWKLAEKDDDVYDVHDGLMSFACWIADDKCKKCPIRKKAGKCASGGDLWSQYKFMGEWTSREDWADVCNRMADAWREIPEN